MASWQSRYAFEPFTEDLRNPSLPEGRSVVRIEPGSAQAARVLGGEGGCWGACMRMLSENGGRWKPGSALDGLMAMAERCAQPLADSSDSSRAYTRVVALPHRWFPLCCRLWSAQTVVDVECAATRMEAAHRLLEAVPPT